MSHQRNGSDHFDDIDTFIQGLPQTGQHAAILVIDTATPDQYDELIRIQGQDAADVFKDISARSIGAWLPPHASLYTVSDTRFSCAIQSGAAQHIEAMLDDLAGRIRRPGQEQQSFPVATSIGIGVACYPQHGTDAAVLHRAAVSAALASRENGDPWCAYDPAFDSAALRAGLILRDIVSALAQKEQLRLVYQPKTDIATGRCIGAEALIRWNHPALGAIPPCEFVSLIERTALMSALTDWTLAAALPQIALWRAEGLDPRISINVSMRDLRDNHFAARLADLLQRHAVQPDWINIEVTESALVNDPVRVRRQLDAIKRLGIAIEIDDYGTGQSGLSYLKFIPASYLKIDQSFVSRLASDRTDRIIVRSTIGLAHELGLRVVAEGIKDKDTLDWLRDNGCDIGQGNLLSPPLEAAGFERLLRLQAP